MLRFRSKSSGPLGDPRSAERWLPTLPTNDPLVAQRSIVAELRTVAERTARRGPATLEAVFCVDAYAHGLARTLTTQYVQHVGRSAKIGDQLWQALFELAQGFQECYAAFARDLGDQPPGGKWRALLPGLIGRQIAYLRQDAKLRLYRCERWDAAKWSGLFGIFMRACGHRFEREPLRLTPMGGPTTIEREFLMTLLLHLANPGNLTPNEVEWIAEQLDAWCQPLRLTVTPASSTTFYVDLAGSAGLRRRALAPLDGRVLFVDLRPLHALLVQNQTVLEQAVRSEPRSESNSRHREQLGLFNKIASRIDPEYQPLARRGERKLASGPVDAIVGFPSICTYLRRDDTTAIAPTGTRRSFGDAMEIAVFGRAREPGSGLRPVPERLSPLTAPGRTWEIKDISASGFRLNAPMGTATELTLNTLVAIRRRDQEAWVLGIVRRMRRLSAQEAEIGLQLIANSLANADLWEQRKVREADYSVNGQTPTATGREFRGLFLSFNRREGEPPVQSLIVPVVEYHASRHYMLRTEGSPRTIRYGRVLERHADWVWTFVDPPTPGTAAAGSDPAA
jgi:hypothetical protein